MKTKIPFFLLAVFFLTACTDKQAELKEDIIGLVFTKRHNDKTRAQLALLQEEYIAQYPTDSFTQSCLENVSFFYLNVDSLEKAKSYARQYVKAYPESENAKDVELVIAKAFYKQARYLEAVEVYERVQNRGDFSISDTRNLSFALKDASRDTTLPNSDYLYYKSVACEELVNGLPEAIMAYEGFLDKYPNSRYVPSALALLSDKLERNGEVERAKEVLKTIIEKYPESEQAATARTMLEKNLVGLSAEEQLERILKDKAAN